MKKINVRSKVSFNEEFSCDFAPELQDIEGELIFLNMNPHF